MSNLTRCQCGQDCTPMELAVHTVFHREAAGDAPVRLPGFRAALDAHIKEPGHGLTFRSCEAPACLAYWAAVGR